MERKLASIQKVIGLAPIEGADSIEIAFVLGWQIVVRKGEFSVGDKVVFYEIDAFLPAEDIRYETFKERFITWDNKEGMRLRTIKLRKALSQGLILSVDKFQEIKNPKEGDDVTNLLKILKWEIIEKTSNGSRAMGSGKTFPPFIQKTDQERIQNYGALVSKATEESFEVTVKKDGSSLTFYAVQPSSPYYQIAKDFESKKVKGLLNKIKKFFSKFTDKKIPVTGLCSRNILLDKEGDSNFSKVVLKYDLESKLLSSGKSYALQGELVAPDIQGNYEKVKDVEFHLFDVFDIDRQKYLTPDERVLFARAYNIPHVTVLSVGKLIDIMGDKEGDIVKDCLAFAEGKGDNNGVMREGVVFKSLTRDFSFKAISNSYLLKQK
jgi:RNA ligase (TIGR02306 family)